MNEGDALQKRSKICRVNLPVNTEIASSQSVSLVINRSRGCDEGFTDDVDWERGRFFCDLPWSLGRG